MLLHNYPLFLLRKKTQLKLASHGAVLFSRQRKKSDSLCITESA